MGRDGKRLNREGDEYGGGKSKGNKVEISVEEDGRGWSECE